MANVQLPDNVHKLRGTYREDRHGDPSQKVELPVESPPIPKIVEDNEEALAEWHYITDVMAEMGILSRADKAMLAMYCLLYADLAERGNLMGSEKFTQLRMIQQQLGITTVTRCKLSKPKGKKGAYSSFT